jgi:hypothetical protein
MFKEHAWVLLDVIFQEIPLNGTPGREEKVDCSRRKLSFRLTDRRQACTVRSACAASNMY